MAKLLLAHATAQISKLAKGMLEGKGGGERQQKKSYGTPGHFVRQLLQLRARHAMTTSTRSTHPQDRQQIFHGDNRRNTLITAIRKLPTDIDNRMTRQVSARPTEVLWLLGHFATRAIDSHSPFRMWTSWTQNAEK